MYDQEYIHELEKGNDIKGGRGSGNSIEILVLVPVVEENIDKQRKKGMKHHVVGNR
jgi:hypothetical protein